ncbi:MAG TPA: ABC transporter ATP-binding protein, partial [Oscillospiraceae bacterium]|nr:ABC transporter ATP-binding protein [Oscillospiraceae bacterium]
LMRLYDPDEGSIKIDGRDLRSIPESELRSKFGVVFQNDTVFADTVYENIDFGRGLPKENIISAANFAQAEEFINSLEDGYDAQISAKGSNLSGGQKQRLLIARALAGKPEILLLDDSSSALDYATDARLRRSLNENFKDSTKIIVAQRISSIMHAEKIIMLDDGAIAGMGTHEELLENCEIYREIYASQMGGGIADAIRNEYAGNKRFG